MNLRATQVGAARRPPSPHLLKVSRWSGSPPRTLHLIEPFGQPDVSAPIKRHLAAREAVFDFCVQPQTDPATMPIEDVSIEWSESESRPKPVATLTIPVQDIDSAAGRALAERCEVMSFSPWNALPEHRPMGGINRLRKAVYMASRTRRTGA